MSKRVLNLAKGNNMQETAATGNRRILVIDDNRAIHEDYKKILTPESDTSELEQLGAFVCDETVSKTTKVKFELFSAFQGQEGMELVKLAVADKRPFAMAFVDMRMPPGWDGLETIGHLWEADPCLQIVICSAYSDYSWSEIIQRVERRDQLLILKKPFDSIEVIQLAISLTQKWDLERQSQQRMWAIVETAADGFITFSENGVIESCNGASCDLFGCERAELVGNSFVSLLPDTQEMQWEQVLRDRLGVNESFKKCTRELSGRRKDGTVVPLSLSLSAFATDSGRIFTAILRDLTDHKRLQYELAQAQKLEAIGQLAAGIAHEINTPMQFVSDNIAFLSDSSQRLFEVVDGYQRNLFSDGQQRSWAERRQELDEMIERNQFESIRTQVPQAIAESLEGIQRVIHIVRAMKEFSHPGSEQKEGVDLNNAVASTVTITRNRWKYVADLELDLDPNLPTLKCIPADINQVLLNLIVNAADAIADKVGDGGEVKGQITVRTRSDDESIVIEVEDTGCGIPAEIRNRIFDPFFTTKDVGKGTGQGLAICYNVVVNKHQGTIDVQSIPGAGTTFRVVLPRVAKTVSRATTEEDEDAERAELALA